MDFLYISDYDKAEYVYDFLSPITGQYLYLNNELSYIDSMRKKGRTTYFTIITIKDNSTNKYSIVEFYDLFHSKKIKFLESIKSKKTTYFLDKYYLLNNDKVYLTNILKPLFDPFENNKDKLNLNEQTNRIALETKSEDKFILTLEQADKKLKPFINEELQSDYRKKYLPEFRADDGHYVRSQGEMIIDNWLYNNNYLHEYEKKVLYEDEEFYIDFYVKKTNTYIEYFGLTNNEEYNNKSQHKKEIYKNLGIKCIYIYPDDIKHIQDILQKALTTINDTTDENNLF